MSDVLIIGSAGFVGSNIASYAVQNTKFDIASVDDLAKHSHLMNLAPAMAAKSRHSFYLAKAQDIHIMGKLLDLEKPKHIIYNAFAKANLPEDIYNQFDNFRNFLVACSGHALDTLIILLKDFYERPAEHKKLQEMIGTLMAEAYPGKWFVISTCELFGARQDSTSFVTQNIVGLLSGFQVFPAADKPRELMYVRDFFCNLVRLLEGEDVLESGIYRMFSGQSGTDEDVCKLMEHVISGAPEHLWQYEKTADRPSGIDLPMTLETILPKALEHTAWWYNHNRWSWSK